MHEVIGKGAALIREGKRILVFTGAGMSTESGIPDYRSPGGVWERYDPSDFYFPKILSSENVRERYWQMSREFYRPMKDALPNRGHRALRALEDTGKLMAIVTQNIDRLHHKAGSSAEKIIELHGTAFSVSCLSCGKEYERDEIEKRLDRGLRVPYCDDCSGILKPDTISFGQPMPEQEMAQSLLHARSCDLCLVLGSSLLVYPAAMVPEQAVETGANLMIINRDETPLDSSAQLVIHRPIGETLATILEHVASVQIF